MRCGHVLKSGPLVLGPLFLSITEPHARNDAWSGKRNLCQERRKVVVVQPSGDMLRRLNALDFSVSFVSQDSNLECWKVFRAGGRFLVYGPDQTLRAERRENCRPFVPRYLSMQSKSKSFEYSAIVEFHEHPSGVRLKRPAGPGYPRYHIIRFCIMTHRKLFVSGDVDN